ncbi:MAG: E3 binding domain-containing protein [Saprospiraceae bacterium]|nr:E3 binding domain-containing protein [Saprospiraceae bacterium]
MYRLRRRRMQATKQKTPNPKRLITPRALDLLMQAGIDPMDVRGTGKNGNILVKDAKAAIDALEMASNDPFREEEE